MNRLKKESYFNSGFTLALIVSLLITFTVWIFGSYQAFLSSNETVSEAVSEWHNIASQTQTWQSIFFHNLKVTCLLIVPLIGIFWWVFIATSNGFLIGALAAYYKISPIILTVKLWANPVGVFEMGAYILMFAENIYTCSLTLKGKALKRIKNHYWKTIILYVVMLFIAANIEIQLITT